MFKGTRCGWNTCLQKNTLTLCCWKIHWYPCPHIQNTIPLRMKLILCDTVWYCVILHFSYTYFEMQTRLCSSVATHVMKKHALCSLVPALKTKNNEKGQNSRSEIKRPDTRDPRRELHAQFMVGSFQRFQAWSSFTCAKPAIFTGPSIWISVHLISSLHETFAKCSLLQILQNPLAFEEPMTWKKCSCNILWSNTINQYKHHNPCLA